METNTVEKDTQAPPPAAGKPKAPPPAAKRGRGRPRKDGSPASSTAPAADAAPGASLDAPPTDAERAAAGMALMAMCAAYESVFPGRGQAAVMAQAPGFTMSLVQLGRIYGITTSPKVIAWGGLVASVAMMTGPLLMQDPAPPPPAPPSEAEQAK